LRIRSLIQKWAVDKDKRSDEEKIIKSSMVSYFPDSTKVKVWCIDDACVILMNSITKSDICKYSKGSIFMGYSNCEEKHASHSSDEGITYISIGVIYNSIEDQINGLY
jgi:nucleoside diphosphate kinase